MRVRKYDYVWVIQGSYGQGWEDECAEVTRAEMRENLRLYRENSPYPVRVIRRRLLREQSEANTQTL